MIRGKLNRLFPVGLLMLASGLILHNWMHGRYWDFAAGFLIGLSIIFVIVGFVGRSRGATS